MKIDPAVHERSRIISDTLHNQHTRINKLSSELGYSEVRFMYTAKDLPGEIERMKSQHRRERLGTLPNQFVKCATFQSPAVPIENNYLQCALGVKCKECKYLKAIDEVQTADPSLIDEMKAYTCATHIVQQIATKQYDMSEGFLQDKEDRMYWQNLYKSLAMSEENESGLEGGDE